MLARTRARESTPTLPPPDLAGSPVLRKKNGIHPATAEWFEDKETERTLKRTAFDRPRQAIFAGTVKTVVVWNLDGSLAASLTDWIC